MTFHGIRLGVVGLALIFVAPFMLAQQQTLGSLNGTVLDASGASVPGATVTAVNDQTTLTRAVKTSGSGFWQILDLPIGTYGVTIARDGFETERVPRLLVQVSRTTTPC